MNTSERLSIMENEVKNLKENNSTEHRAMLKKLTEFINTADKKYAPRWLMTILSWVAGLLGVIVSTSVIKIMWE